MGSDGRIIVTNNPGFSNIRPSRSASSFTASSFSTNRVPALYSNKISILSLKYKLREDLILAVA
ncbi:MAG: hypothetical protein KAR14_08660, partial [Candidatus Aminicenantes bacterium]|nr:hypothetical protein [Candidatus Aminicenantes bacterium]